MAMLRYCGPTDHSLPTQNRSLTRPRAEAPAVWVFAGGRVHVLKALRCQALHGANLPQPFVHRETVDERPATLLEPAVLPSR